MFTSDADWLISELPQNDKTWLTRRIYVLRSATVRVWSCFKSHQRGYRTSTQSYKKPYYSSGWNSKTWCRVWILQNLFWWREDFKEKDVVAWLSIAVCILLFRLY